MTTPTPITRVLMAAACLAVLGAAPAASAPPSPSPKPSASPAAAARPKPPRRGVFTLVNKTEWTIQGVLMSAAEEDDWSANRIKGKPLGPGATVKLDVDCDEMDVRLVDTKGKTCTSESMYLCGRHGTWTVTPQEIAGCKEFGR
jgi:hypothetical protein